MNSGDLSHLVYRGHLNQALVNITGCEDVQILDLEVKRATSGFDGFLSVVLRVKVFFTTKGNPLVVTKSLFVKSLPLEKLQLDLVRVSNVFKREGVFYGSVLPLMRQVAAGNLNLPLPQCHHVFNDGVNDVLYLEDLAEFGYGSVARECKVNGLDWEHSSLVARNVGVLHALVIAAERLLPPGKRSWIEAYPLLGKDAIHYVPKPGDPQPPFKGVAETGNEVIVEVAGRMSGLPKLAADSGKLRSVALKFWPIVCELVKPSSKGPNVLCHGDCWANNFMFKYSVGDDGKETPVGMKFVDFQMAKYCHPSVDLLYFMYLGLSKAHRDEYCDKIIGEYYDSLRKSLEILKYGKPPFSLQKFSSDLKEVYRPYAVYFCAVYTPCMLLGEDFAPKNIEDMTPEKFQKIVSSGNVTAIRQRLANDPSYRSNVEAAVREFVELVFPNGSVETCPFLG